MYLPAVVIPCRAHLDNCAFPPSPNPRTTLLPKFGCAGDLQYMKGFQNNACSGPLYCGHCATPRNTVPLLLTSKHRSETLMPCGGGSSDCLHQTHGSVAKAANTTSPSARPPPLTLAASGRTVTGLPHALSTLRTSHLQTPGAYFENQTSVSDSPASST
ncbi:hypothetical protein BC567DRAFT_6280 [Phyllosticta citribraziliensis]